MSTWLSAANRKPVGPSAGTTFRPARAKLKWLRAASEPFAHNPLVWRRERLWHRAVGRGSRPGREDNREGQVFGMLIVTVLLAMFLLNTIAWAVHDSRTVVERHKEIPWH